jgi:hypothetical protein
MSLELVDVRRLLLSADSDPSDWCGLVFRTEGIFRRNFAQDEAAWNTLTPREAAACGTPNKLLLQFPCTHEQLEQFVDDEGLQDGIISRRLHLLRVLSRSKSAAAPAQGPAVALVEAATAAQATGAAPVQPAAAPRRIVKREVLVKELKGEWLTIASDLNDAARNGLKVAKADKHGYWDVEAARCWAAENYRLAAEPKRTANVDSLSEWTKKVIQANPCADGTNG